MKNVFSIVFSTTVVVAGLGGIAGVNAQNNGVVTEPFEVGEEMPQEIDISIITDDPRYVRNYCKLLGVATEAGDCPDDFLMEEIFFGSIPDNRSQFHNTIALHMEGKNSAGLISESICSGSLISPALVLTIAKKLVNGSTTEPKTHISSFGVGAYNSHAAFSQRSIIF